MANTGTDNSKDTTQNNTPDSTDKSNQQSTDKASQNPADKSDQNSTGKSGQKPADGATGKSSGADNATDGLTKPKTDVPAAKAEGQPETSSAVSSDSKPGSDPKTKEAEQKNNTKSTDSAGETKNNESEGRGPKPLGAEQQTWDDPEASDEVKKKIEDQKARLEKLHDNPNAQDPKLEELNKKQDIESRNEDPDHDKKSENTTQQNFDPRKNETDAPAH